MWLLPYLLVDLSYAGQQTVRVVGRVSCNRRSYEGALIQLMEKDFLDPDDQLASMTTGKKGNFDLTGTESEMGELEVFLTIEHRCKAKAGCKWTKELSVPAKYLNSKEAYNMTYLALDIRLENDKESC